MLTIEEKRKLWLDDFASDQAELEKTALENIEKHRKGYCKLRLVDKDGNPVAGKKIKVTQDTHDFKYGANIFMLDEFKDESDNKKYREMFREYFNLATIPFYWDALEPEKGKPRFDRDSVKIYRRPAPELCAEYCEENGIAAKLHCLVYDKFIPDWLPKNDEKAMEAAYEERIRQIAERYAGRFYEFEVINESMCDFNWPTKSVISDKRDVVEWAFALARKYLPNDTLMINEGRTFHEKNLGFRNAYFMQLEKALMNGASIDKIGIQYHIFLGTRVHSEEELDEARRNHAVRSDPKCIAKLLGTLETLGLPLEITEVTLPTLGDTPDDEEIQAEMLKNAYTLWFGCPKMESVVYWNTVDGYAYQTAVTNENNGRGGLFHHDITPKKSALMLKKLFSEVWNTKEELVSDDNGYIEFRGFFGDYKAEIDKKTCSFGIHKGGSNVYEIIV